VSKDRNSLGAWRKAAPHIGAPAITRNLEFWIPEDLTLRRTSLKFRGVSAMDKGFVSRIAMVLLGIIVLFLISVGIITSLFPDQRQVIVSAASRINLDSTATSIINYAINYALLGFALINYRAILSFVRQTVKRTDAQIVGDWHVSRYIKKNNKSEIFTERWRIGRDWRTSRYTVQIYEDWKGDWKSSGRVMYNERDRLNILLDGTNHHQQSSVCFQVNIPRHNDSRILGLGVGDDSQYVLSARVYLAARKRLDDARIRKVIDGATNKLRTDGANGPLFQLPVDIISKVFEDNPLPKKARSSRN
jgi:hypothetical protein